MCQVNACSVSLQERLQAMNNLWIFFLHNKTTKMVPVEIPLYLEHFFFLTESSKYFNNEKVVSYRCFQLIKLKLNLWGHISAFVMCNLSKILSLKK